MHKNVPQSYALAETPPPPLRKNSITNTLFLWLPLSTDIKLMELTEEELKRETKIAKEKKERGQSL